MSLLTLNFPADQNFEPTAETKEKILYTHKSNRQFAGISIPGIFQTTNHTLHLIAFFLILVIEAIATWYCWDKGVDPTAIIVAIMVDILLALLSHRPHKEILKLKNQLIFTEGTLAINIQNAISKLKLKQNLFFILIFILAGFKIYWFCSVYGFVFDTTTLLIIVSYTLAAVMHIAFTGFALFGLFVSIFLNNDYRDFIKSNGTKNFYNLQTPLRHIFETKLELVECVVNDKHKLVKNKENSYQFETFGLLTDKDLVEFIMKQNDANQKREIIVEGIKHQLTILQTDPNK